MEPSPGSTTPALSVFFA